MATIQVQLRQVQIGLDDLNAVAPDPFQAPVGAPLLEVVVDRLPTDLLFVGSLGSGSIGSCVH
jgi:hypothetical protein